MSMLDDMNLAPTQAMEPAPPRQSDVPPPRPSRIGPILSLALVAGLVAGFWVYRVRQTAPAEAPVPAPVASPKARTAPLAEGGPAVVLPPLDQFDPFLRDTLSSLTKAPVALAWLSTNHLAEQFVAIVQSTAEGQAPMRMLAALRRGSFRVTTQGGRTVIDSASYARYDGIADAVTSLDPAASAKIYGVLKPRLEEAYASLGIADSSMDAALEGAIVKLLSTPVPDDPIEVQASGGVYAYASPALEQLSSAQKLLIRTGPANARKIQARLREIALALGIPASRLPGT
jgi:Protein of unknown function (DUF3014)